MEESVRKLRESIKAFMDKLRNRDFTDEEMNEKIYDVILAAAELFKDEGILLHTQLNEEGDMKLYCSGGKVYLPLFTGEDEMDDPKFPVHQPISMKELCLMAQDNLYYYGLLDQMAEDPLSVIDQGHTYQELIEYTEGRPRVAGIVLDPSGICHFFLEGWILDAVVYKGAGVTSFETFDPETGEKKHGL